MRNCFVYCLKRKTKWPIKYLNLPYLGESGNGDRREKAAECGVELISEAPKNVSRSWTTKRCLMSPHKPVSRRARRLKSIDSSARGAREKSRPDMFCPQMRQREHDDEVSTGSGHEIKRVTVENASRRKFRRRRLRP